MFENGLGFMYSLIAKVDERKRIERKESFGITIINNKEGVERLNIPFIYSDIELRGDEKTLHIHCYDDNGLITVYTEEGKELFIAKHFEYLKQGMFFVGEMEYDNKKRSSPPYALFNSNGEQLTDYIFANTSMFKYFNENGFIVVRNYDEYNDKFVINIKGEIVYEKPEKSYNDLYLYGVICYNNAYKNGGYFNLLTGKKICGENLSQKLETNEFLFIGGSYNNKTVYQINKNTGDFIIHGEAEIEELPKTIIFDKVEKKIEEPKIKLPQRNDICLCGSNLKYKNCCLNKK